MDSPCLRPTNSKYTKFHVVHGFSNQHKIFKCFSIQELRCEVARWLDTVSVGITLLKDDGCTLKNGDFLNVSEEKCTAILDTDRCETLHREEYKMLGQLLAEHAEIDDGSRVLTKLPTHHAIKDWALLHAARCNLKCATSWLLRAGAYINTCFDEGNTPLICACDNGHKDIVEILLHAGANTTKDNYEMWTPLMCASYGGHSEIVDMLIDESNRCSSTL